MLWTATRYCVPVELQTTLLGVSEDLAARRLEQCQGRVAASAQAAAAQP